MHAATPGDSAQDQVYTIGQLSKEFGVTARAIRFYESHGLLAPGRKGQRRIYSRRDRTRLKLTLRGRRIGMSLAEIREVFDLYDMAHGKERQLEYYLAILEEKRTALQRQLKDVQDVLAELEDSAEHCRAILAAQRAAGA